MTSQPAKDARRTELLNAASELLVIHPAASLAEIAEHAGIGKATLHRYFASREDLMLALGYRALELVTQAVQDARPEQDKATDALIRILEALIPLGDKVHFLLNERILDHHPDFLAADRLAQEPVLRVLERGQAAGELRTDLTAEWMLHIVNYSLYATWHSVHYGFVARRDAARMLASTLLGGITAPPA